MVTLAQAFFTGVTNGRPQAQAAVSTDEIARISIHAVFQARPTAVTAEALAHMERRDRIVLILLDGQRTINDVMRLLHRTEAEVAQVLVRLLKNGHIHFMGTRRT
jgi:hypothetical protein